MRLHLEFDRRAGMAVLHVWQGGHRTEIRGDIAVGVRPTGDALDALLGAMSGPGVSHLFAGDTLQLSPGKPGRTNGDWAVVTGALAPQKGETR